MPPMKKSLHKKLNEYVAKKAAPEVVKNAII